MRHFHKIAPFLHRRHLYPLSLCSPTPFPRNLCCIFKNPQVFLLLKATLIRGWGVGGVTAFKQSCLINERNC